MLYRLLKKIQYKDRHHGCPSADRNCGLFALAYATTLCNGELPQYKTYIQKEMQPHLIKCLQESTPTVVLRVLGTSEIVELQSLEWLLAADIHIMQTTESVGV